MLANRLSKLLRAHCHWPLAAIFDGDNPLRPGCFGWDFGMIALRHWRGRRLGFFRIVSAHRCGCESWRSPKLVGLLNKVTALSNVLFSSSNDAQSGWYCQR